MLKSFRKIYPIYVLVDILLMGIAFYLPFYIKYHTAGGLLREAQTINFREYNATYLIWAIFIFLFFKRRNLFSTDRGLTIFKETFRVCINVIYSALLISTTIFFAQYKFFSREVFLENTVLLCLLLSVWRITKRIILRKLIAQGFHTINVLIIGAERLGRIVLNEIRRTPWLGLRVVGFLDESKKGEVDQCPILGAPGDFEEVARKHFVDEVIITRVHHEQFLTELINAAKDLSVGVREVPPNFEEALSIMQVVYLGPIPLITYKRNQLHPSEMFFKKLFDFIASLILLVLTAPLFGLLALLVKLDSPGPALYVTKRVGLRGRVFNFYKFRSMVSGADKLKSSLNAHNEVKDGVIFKMKKDPRITGVGRFLRRYSLDELPQLLNVLMGDMSLVGPRPPLPEETEQYHYRHLERLSIKPGITGLSQVKGRSDLSFYRWVKWDLWYVAHWSFGLDLKILWWTIPAVLKGKGAY